MDSTIVKHSEERMKKAVETIRHEIATIRTNKATTSLLDGIKVEYYGTMTPLNQVSSVNVPDPRMITVKPWEKSLIPAIEKAIKARAELGLNPASDGELVRIPIPPLTQDRRKELVKVIKGMAEDARVALRGARRDSNEMLKELLSGGDITEDDHKTGTKKVQELTDKYVSSIDDIIGKKEKEILDV